MFIRTRFGCLFLAALFCAPALLAQQNNPQPQSDGKIYLNVVVAPKSGAPVADLQQQDFTLLDNKSPQPITSFQAFSGRQAIAEVILVIDAVNTDYRNVSVERVQIDKFLRAEGGHLAYPLALAIFTDKGIQMQGTFSTDGNGLSAALDSRDVALRAIGRAAGFYGAADRWQLSIRALRQLLAVEAPHPGRKLVLWVSPGWPLLSGPGVELDSKQQSQLFADIVGISTRLIEARVTLYNINPLGSSESIFSGTYYQEFLKPVTKPSQVNMGNLGLQVLATQSGGLVLNFNNDVASLLQQCLTDAAPYYVISFAPSPSDKRDEYHSLEVKIAKPGLIARTRQGYYAQPATHN
ncbi:MAG: VWA domain-containing protein [Candidatus Acidiferrales bacterium]